MSYNRVENALFVAVVVLIFAAVFAVWGAWSAGVDEGLKRAAWWRCEVRVSGMAPWSPQGPVSSEKPE